MSGTKSLVTPGCFHGKLTILTALLALVVVHTVSADEFHFDYTKGDKYRVLSNVDEDVYINRQPTARPCCAAILQRVSSTPGGIPTLPTGCTAQNTGTLPTGVTR